MCTGITRTLMGRYHQLPRVKNTNTLLGILTYILGNVAADSRGSRGCSDDGHEQDTNEQEIGAAWLDSSSSNPRRSYSRRPGGNSRGSLQVVKKCMEEPRVFGLPKTAVPLTVDGSHIHKSWYDAK